MEPEEKIYPRGIGFIPDLYMEKNPTILYVIDGQKSSRNIWLEEVALTEDDIRYTEFYRNVELDQFKSLFRPVGPEEITEIRKEYFTCKTSLFQIPPAEEKWHYKEAFDRLIACRKELERAAQILSGEDIYSLKVDIKILKLIFEVETNLQDVKLGLYDELLDTSNPEIASAAENVKILEED